MTGLSTDHLALPHGSTVVIRPIRANGTEALSTGLKRRRPGIASETLGLQEIKGRAEPVEVFRIGDLT